VDQSIIYIFTQEKKKKQKGGESTVDYKNKRFKVTMPITKAEKKMTGTTTSNSD